MFQRLRSSTNQLMIKKLKFLAPLLLAVGSLIGNAGAATSSLFAIGGPFENNGARFTSSFNHNSVNRNTEVGFEIQTPPGVNLDIVLVGFDDVPNWALTRYHGAIHLRTGEAFISAPEMRGGATLAGGSSGSDFNVDLTLGPNLVSGKIEFVAASDFEFRPDDQGVDRTPIWLIGIEDKTGALTEQFNKVFDDMNSGAIDAHEGMHALRVIADGGHPTKSTIFVGDYDMQASPIPEPSSALLLLFGSFLGFRRRR